MSAANEANDPTLWSIGESSTELDSVARYWAEYEAMRPKYRDSLFLDTIYEYHASKAGCQNVTFSTVHDVACGAGKAGRELAERFENVVASDSNESSLNAMRLSCPPSVKNIQYVLSGAEDIAQHVPHASADLIAAAECVPIFHLPVVLDNFAQILRPHGTLAIWFYGRLHFADETYAKTCQPIVDEIMEIAFYQVISSSSPEGRSTWARAAETMASWLDNVDLPSDRWCSIERHKWNSKHAQMSMGAAAKGLEVVRKSAVRDGETVIEKEDRGMWKREFGIQEIKRYVLSSFPGIDAFLNQDARVSQLFHDLTYAMGGDESRRQITWPVSLILATLRP